MSTFSINDKSNESDRQLLKSIQEVSSACSKKSGLTRYITGRWNKDSHSFKVTCTSVFGESLAESNIPVTITKKLVKSVK